MVCFSKHCTVTLWLTLRTALSHFTVTNSLAPALAPALAPTPTRSGAYSYPLPPTPTPVSRCARFVAVSWWRHPLRLADAATRKPPQTALCVAHAAADSVCAAIRALSATDEESSESSTDDFLLRTSSAERAIPALSDDVGPLVHFYAKDVLAEFSAWWGGPIAWTTGIVGLSALIIIPQAEQGNTFLVAGAITCTAFASIPLLIPAAATTRCVEILALLNQQRAFSTEDGLLRGMVEPEVDARISTICRYFNSLNNGLGPGFTIYGVPVSRQYLTMLAIKVATLAGALIPVLVSMQNKLDQINHLNLNETSGA